MKGLNKVMIIGRLGKDPEVRYTQGNQAYVKFSVATDETWNDRNGEKQTRTEWHNIVGWGKLAEICGKFLKKGRLVYVEGRLQTRQWDAQDGTKRYTTEIVMSDMSILESRQGGGAGDSGPGGYHDAAGQGGGYPPEGSGSFSGQREEYSYGDSSLHDDEDVPF